MAKFTNKLNAIINYKKVKSYKLNVKAKQVNMKINQVKSKYNKKIG